MRTCETCGRVLPVREFWIGHYRKQADGRRVRYHGHLDAECGECRSTAPTGRARRKGKKAWAGKVRTIHAADLPADSKLRAKGRAR